MPVQLLKILSPLPLSRAGYSGERAFNVFLQPARCYYRLKNNNSLKHSYYFKEKYYFWGEDLPTVPYSPRGIKTSEITSK